MSIKSLLIGASLLLTGCANLNSINHKKTLSATKPSIFSMDARQRAIISRIVKTETEVWKRNLDGSLFIDTDGYQVLEGYAIEHEVRMCAEQFPDVFTVLSASLSAQLAAKNEKEVQSISGNLAAAMQESGTTIARTQTVNLLREAMFRTCERYMNGALDNDSFALQAIRDQQNMVSVLAIEQLTGVVTPPNSSLFGGAGAFTKSQGGAAEVAAALTEAKTDRNNALAAVTSAQSDYDAALKAGAKPTCAEIEDPDKKTTCTKAENDLNISKSNSEFAKTHYNSVEKLNTATEKLNTAFAVSLAKNEQNINNNALLRAKDLKVIANAVTKIVDHTYQANNMSTACIQILLSKIINDKDKTDMCEEYLTKTNEILSQERELKINQETLLAKQQFERDIKEDEHANDIDKIELGHEQYRLNREQDAALLREKLEIEQEVDRLARDQILRRKASIPNATSTESEKITSSDASKNKIIILSSSMEIAKMVDDNLVDKFLTAGANVDAIEMGQVISRTGISNISIRFNTTIEKANATVTTLSPYFKGKIICKADKVDKGYNVLKPGEIEIFIPNKSSIDLTGASAMAGSSQTCTE